MKKKLTEEIKKDKSGKKMWEHIEKLTDKKERANKGTEMYDTNSKIMSETEARKGIKETWNEIYKTGKKDLTPIYSGDWKEADIGKTYNEYQEKRTKDREEKEIEWIEAKKPKYNEEKLKKGLKRLKVGKTAGPDKTKAEVYQALGKKERCKLVLIENLDKIIEEKDIPTSWKKTRTRMIPKKSKPQPKDLRPIAITNISYKLYMSNIGEEIEEHIEKNNLTKGNQIGFTGGGRTEYNHFILQYLVDKAVRRKQQLIVITLDFKKAFDSIDRRKLIEALKEYMINPHIINLIAKIYSNDSTMVTLGELEEEMEVNSGIKQGCTASTTLFKIITYKIMSSIEEKGDEYEVDNQKISTLFFADDSLAMAKNLESAKKNLKIITEASKYYGLEINKDKSSILVYNNQENITEIEGIKVVDKFKYLGLTVDNKKDIFKTQKQDMLDKLNRAASRTYSVIKRSCNKMLVGKTYWKGVILPSALHGIGLIDPTKKEISKLQTAENKTYRTILGARRGTATAAIRGETGASLMSSRFMKAKIMLARSIWRGKNKLVKEVLKK